MKPSFAPKVIMDKLNVAFSGQTASPFLTEVFFHEDGICRAGLQVRKLALHQLSIFTHCARLTGRNVFLLMTYFSI